MTNLMNKEIIKTLIKTEEDSTHTKRNRTIIGGRINIREKDVQEGNILMMRGRMSIIDSHINHDNNNNHDNISVKKRTSTSTNPTKKNPNIVMIVMTVSPTMKNKVDMKNENNQQNQIKEEIIKTSSSNSSSTKKLLRKSDKISRKKNNNLQRKKDLKTTLMMIDTKMKNMKR